MAVLAVDRGAGGPLEALLHLVHGEGARRRRLYVRVHLAFVRIAVLPAKCFSSGVEVFALVLQ